MSGAMSMGSMAMMMGSMVMQAQGARAQAQASQDAYNYQAGVSRNNAQLAEWQAQDALQRGATAEQKLRLKTADVQGTQRARLAASGVSLAEGSALNILDDTTFLGEQDALTLRDNASKEAWGARNQSSGYTNDASMLTSRAGAQNPNTAMFGSLLGSAGSVASSWYRYGQTTSAPGK